MRGKEDPSPELVNSVNKLEKIILKMLHMWQTQVKTPSRPLEVLKTKAIIQKLQTFLEKVLPKLNQSEADALLDRLSNRESSKPTSP
jgi:hypothetical protein